MSHTAVQGFIDKVNNDQALGAIVTQAFTERSDLDLVALASKHGFDFPREEGLKVWEEIRPTTGCLRRVPPCR